MRKFFIVAAGLILLSQTIYSQRRETFKAFEDSIISIHKAVISEANPQLRNQLNEELQETIKEALEQKQSISYPFNAVKTLSVLTSSDKKIRLVTWYLVDAKGLHEHYGFLQAFNKEEDKYIVYPLTDKWASIRNPATQVLSDKSWFGAVYSDIIPVKTNNGMYYTLIGWNGGNLLSQYKVIEIVRINDKGFPVFGSPVFKDYTKSRIMRVLFEYAKSARLNVTYEAQTYEAKTKTNKKNPENQYGTDTLTSKMIIFDRLIPMDESLQKIPQYYVGESSLNDAFIQEDGVWVFKPNVMGRNPDKPLPERTNQPRDLYRRSNQDQE